MPCTFSTPLSSPAALCCSATSSRSTTSKSSMSFSIGFGKSSQEHTNDSLSITVLDPSLPPHALPCRTISISGLPVIQPNKPITLCASDYCIPTQAALLDFPIYIPLLPTIQHTITQITSNFLSQLVSSTIFIRKISDMGAEKLNFAQTCNLLSQFLKEKRTLQVVPPITKNLLTTMEAAASNPVCQTGQTPSSKPSIDLLSQFTKNPEAALGDQQPGSAARMTIFYGGQVLVFNDLQAEKAKEIMGLATTGSSKIFAGFVKKLGSENQSNVVAENNSQEIKAPQYRKPSTE